MTNILIIGLGSVGKQYLHAAIEQSKNVYFYDPKVTHYETATYFDIEKKNKTDIYFEKIIFCDYSFTRVANYKKIKHLNCNKYIFEKLVTNSYEDVKYLRDQIKKNKDKQYLTHLKWNLLNFKKNLKNITAKNCLGDLVSLKIFGGNCCLAMGGAHWIGLYLDIIEATNLQNMTVASDISFNYESPRSKEIPMLSGSIFIKNQYSPSLDITFERKSHLAPVALFIYSFGIIELTFDGFLRVSSILDKDDLKSFQYKKAESLVEESFNIAQDFNPFKTILLDEAKVELEIGLKVSEIYLAALKQPIVLGSIKKTLEGLTTTEPVKIT